METTFQDEEAQLRARIVERPKNARAMAKLASLLIDRSSQSSPAVGNSTAPQLQQERSDKSEAMSLALNAIHVKPLKPFGYAVLSRIHPDHAERLRLLQSAIELSKNSIHIIARIGLLHRLLVEPRQEQSRNVRGKIGKASRDHPNLTDLSTTETKLYERIAQDLTEAWNKTSLTKCEIQYLAQRDYHIGLFFRKRYPACIHRPRAIHHWKRVMDKLEVEDPHYKLSQFWLATFEENSSAETTITRCPDVYVVGLYSTFAINFDELLVNKLQYKTPLLLRKLLDEQVAIPTENGKSVLT